MIQYSKRTICLLAVWSISLPLFAQEQDVAKVHILGRAEEKAIVLRIAPGSPALWQLSNQHGYMIERFTVTRGTQYLGNTERKLLTPTPLKPIPLAQWEALANQDSFAEVAAEAIYGETFEVSAGFDQDIIQLYNKAKELESRFSFALYSADISLEVAKASGLYLRDTDVKKGERYLYRVYSMVPQTTLKSDTGFVYLNIDEYAPLPKIQDVNATFGDHYAMISWNTKYAQSIYTAYWIDRSEDGKNFKHVTENPFTTVYAENITDPGISYKVDSLPENNKTYYYRVIGVTPFGENSPPSEIIKGEGVEALAATPAIRKVLPAEISQAIIEWEFPKPKESSIKGFEVERSTEHDRGFKAVSKLLPAATRTFKDIQPQGTNYYRIRAQGKGGEQSFSFPVLYQLEDSIPPVAPTGLTGKIDTTGRVTLRWNENTEKDLSGYRVFRSNFKSSEYSQITHAPVDTAGYVELIPLDNLTKDIYYKIQAIDTRFNPSEYSVPVKLIKPDILPPVPPVITAWKSGEGTVRLQWSKSASKDVSKYVLKSRGAGVWSITKTFMPSDSLHHKYNQLKTGKYEFAIDAVDSAGNIGTSKILKVSVAGALPAVVKGIKSSVDRTSKKIVLTWKYEDTSVTKFVIYRSEAEKSATLYKTIEGKDRQFTDVQLTMNTRYRYYIKAVFANGEESEFSTEVSVTY